MVCIVFHIQDLENSDHCISKSISQICIYENGYLRKQEHINYIEKKCDFF